jgi:hypothetical protein
MQTDGPDAASDVPAIGDRTSIAGGLVDGADSARQRDEVGRADVAARGAQRGQRLRAVMRSSVAAAAIIRAFIQRL